MTIHHPRLVGVKHFHTRGDGVRYLVFLYRTKDFTGNLRSSDEGEVVWVSPADIVAGLFDLADGMDDLLDFYMSGQESELYYERDEEQVLQKFLF